MGERASCGGRAVAHPNRGVRKRRALKLDLDHPSGAGHAAANYGADYERLAAVKAIHDPDNLFHINQNIAPAN